MAPSTRITALSLLQPTANRALPTEPSTHPCACAATIHSLQTAAPNCLSCGKIICVREGLGPCSFCHTPLLSPAEIQAIIQELRGEKPLPEGSHAGQALNPAQQSGSRGGAAGGGKYGKHGKGEVFKTLAGGGAGGLTAALEQRDKLLDFQTQNAQRTRVLDEAADFELPGEGKSHVWATPAERAERLKAQARELERVEEAGKDEWERRGVVLEIDASKGKVVRRMGKVGELERTKQAQIPSKEEQSAEGGERRDESERRGGAFSHNPLLGNTLVRPTYKPLKRAKGEPEREGTESRQERGKLWRKVQDDYDDNEAIILDGGVYGTSQQEQR